ncbi:hypothetical protein [Pantoea sp. At-9b]|uniref:hypothetical protein n=1 Tax=Pantoea sp. (strain At-9b) TaxID=592316 RepID=UPI0001B3F882|nr:hypothetical protein [Pantoea sp. At-9b]ADU73052.1 hypothetical protein Pat9b_4072 [Pantoea sp. At-9b]
MNNHTRREQLIRLCALRIRYRRAWQSNADACQLAALLTETERQQRLLAVKEAE